MKRLRDKKKKYCSVSCGVVLVVMFEVVVITDNLFLVVTMVCDAVSVIG